MHIKITGRLVALCVLLVLTTDSHCQGARREGIGSAEGTGPSPIRSGQIRLALKGNNEASSLLAVTNVDFLSARGWDLAFWTVLDEGRVEKAIALIGKSKGKDKWAIERVRVKKVKGHKGKTDDSEALCRKDGYVYILGSHFGKKRGKDHLREERQFIARFKESSVFAKPDKLTIDELVVSRDEFLLHRLINKRLKELNVPVGEHTEKVKETIKEIIRETQREYKGKWWVHRVGEGDRPINIEGAVFLESGSLLLGLRYPVSENGNPILVEVEDIDVLFEEGEPVISNAWVLQNVGGKEELRGIRAMERIGDCIHIITGNIDSKPDISILLQAHGPAGIRARSAHYKFVIPKGGVQQVSAQLVRNFAVGDVEGIAFADGRFFCARDKEEEVIILFYSGAGH